MPRPLTTDARNALRNDRHKALAWLLELTTTDGVLAGWNQTKPVTYDSTDFEALGDRFRLAGELKLGTDLVAEPLTILFDASIDLDSDTFIGRLMDRTWHQRRVRLRGVLFDTSSEWVTPIGTVIDWRGFMDKLERVEGAEGVVTSLTCEGGTFRALARNMHTCTDLNQKDRASGDLFFQNTGIKPTQDIPFGVHWGNVPGSGERAPNNDKRTKWPLVLNYL